MACLRYARHKWRQARPLASSRALIARGALQAAELHEQQLREQRDAEERQLREQEQIAETKRSDVEAARAQQESVELARRVKEVYASLPCVLVKRKFVPAGDEGGTVDWWTWSFGLDTRAVVEYRKATEGPHRVRLQLAAVDDGEDADPGNAAFGALHCKLAVGMQPGEMCVSTQLMYEHTGTRMAWLTVVFCALQSSSTRCSGCSTSCSR